MTEHEPAGPYAPPRPGATGGEVQSLPASFSPSQRRDEALLIETISGYRHDEA